MGRLNSSMQPRTESKKIFPRLFNLWGNYRRIILLVAITAVLINFILSLDAPIRRSLVGGLLKQQAVVVLLLLFSLLPLSLLWSAGQRLDAWIFLLFNLRGFHPFWLDRLMWIITQIGNGVVGIVLGIFLYFIGYRDLSMQLLFGFLTLWLAVELIKAIVERTRPFLVLEGARIIGWRERGKSFPSGHTAQAFFMAALLVNSFDTGALMSVMLYGTAALVALTRIYVGAHYPRDVIAGAVLGSVWGLLSGLIDGYFSTGHLLRLIF